MACKGEPPVVSVSIWQAVSKGILVQIPMENSTKSKGGLGAETHVFLPKYYHHSPRDTQRFGSQSVWHLLPVPLAASDSGARPPKQ